MRAILILLAGSLLASAACPTSGGFTKTCFVSLTGNNTTGNGTITAPYRGVVKAVSVMAAGDTLILRGGRYTTQAENSGANWGAPGCTAALPCTVRAMQGEVVIIDGRGWTSSGALFATPTGNHLLTPPYGDDPQAGHWRFVGLRVEEMPRFVFWMQSQNDDVHLKAIRIHGTIGARISSCDGSKVHGTHIDITNLNMADGASGPAIDCTPVLPGNTQVPWKSLTYDAAGKPGTTASQYQLENVTPRFPTIQSYGCRNFQMMDTFLRKELSSATDLFGIEYGRDVLIERVNFVSPWSYGGEANYGGSTGGTDAFDMKVTGITIKDVESRGGKASMKLWGKIDTIKGALVVGAEDASESNVSLAGTMATSSSIFPAAAAFVPIRYAGNTPDGDAYIVVGGGPYGNSPSDGSHVELVDVPGCTSINKHVRVKSSVENKHFVFVLENTDGSQLTCNAPYDHSAQLFRSDARTATFTGGGSANITLASDVNWGAFGIFVNTSLTFTTAGSLPAELTAGVRYYVKTKSGTTLTISATPGGPTITFAGTGTGAHTVTLRDDYMSYAGKMLPPSTDEGRATWGNTITYVTAISPRGSALNGCTNCTSSAYEARKFKYNINHGIFVSPRLDTIAAPIASFGGPRAILSGSVVHLAYHDAEAMAVGNRVSFRTTGTFPASIAANTLYHIVASDNANRTIQISPTPGGAPVSFSGGNGRYWLQVPGLSTTNVELSLTTNIPSGVTVRLRGAVAGQIAAALPHPFVSDTDYTVDSVSTVNVNGTDVHLAVLSSGGVPISHSSSGSGTWKLYRASVAAQTNSRNFDIGGYVERSGSGFNHYYVGGNTATNAYCAKVHGDAGFNPVANCVSTLSEVETLEPGSKIENPAIDLESGRASAGTPATAWNRGYYASFHEVVAVAATAAHVRNKFPADPASEAATSVVDDNSDFSSPLESFNLTAPGRVQNIVFGKLSPLAPNTTYHYKLTQGFDVVTGSFTTAADSAGSGTLQVSLTAPAGVAVSSAVAETSVDGSVWVPTSAAVCTVNCTINVNRDKGMYWLRHRFLSAGGTTLLTSQSAVVVVR